jgi:hypothetical protein
MGETAGGAGAAAAKTPADVAPGEGDQPVSRFSKIFELNRKGLNVPRGLVHRRARSRAERVAFGPSSQRTNGTTHSMQRTGRLRLTGLTPLALSQSTTSLSQIGSDRCTMNRWAVLGSNTCLTSHSQFCL